MSEVVSFDRTTLAERVHRWLREQILTGQRQQGERLQEPAVAAELGVSVTPVREAIRLLHGDGLVTYGERSGVRVVELSEVEIDHCFAVRRALEALALRQAAPNLSAEDKEHLFTLAERTVEAEGQPADCLLKLDRAFHRFFIEKAGNRWLLEYLNRLSDLITIARIPLYLDPNVPQTTRDHKAIATALLKGDVEEAQMHLDFHLSRVCQNAIRACRSRSTEAENDP